MESVLRLENVDLDYGSHEIIRDANLHAGRGETKVILGPSGVGKSTILKAILGILKPKKGEIHIRDREISRLPERELVRLRLGMSMVFQHGALFDSMTVAENVSFRLREFGLLRRDSQNPASVPKSSDFGLAEREKIQKRVEEVLHFVGLAHIKNLRPAQLSGGMRKRVAIARALAPDPDIFLFDEPTVGLDPVNHFNIEQLILKLKQQKRRTMLIVTHDVESACRIADSIAMVHEGRFIFDGTPQELKNQTDKRIRAFLDPASFARLI